MRHEPVHHSSVAREPRLTVQRIRAGGAFVSANFSHRIAVAVTLAVLAASSANGQTGPSGIAVRSSLRLERPPANSTGAGQSAVQTLSLTEALTRAFAHNLIIVGRENAARVASAQETLARSALRPNLTASASDVEQKLNLGALGLQLTPSLPGFTYPDTVGPFNVFDLRTRASQTLFDRTAMRTWQASRATTEASGFGARDSRDTIALAVGTAYLRVAATEALLRAVDAQVATAAVLLERTTAQRDAGLATPLDVNRARVQWLADTQQVRSIRTDVATQKIDLARLVGLPPNVEYTLSTAAGFTPAPVVDVDDAIARARRDRADVQAAEAYVRAAEHSLASAQATRLPTVSVSADYGGSRASDASIQSTYTVGAFVRIPIWEGGRTRGAIEQATATLAMRRAELDDLRQEVEAQVRKAFLQLETSAGSVGVARQSAQITAETLALARQRFEAGVGDNLSVVQAQQAVAQAAHEQIAAVFAHNLLKLTLARALGRAAGGLSEFVSAP